MNLRQLEAFRATIESGSITGAADLLHISQPSVSRLIGDLERSVGFPLFIRAGRGLVSTVEARRFYQAVESMFIGTDRLKELADTIRTTAGGVVSVGVIPAFSYIVMPEAVGELYENRPDVRIMVYTRNTPSIVDAVRMLQFDLGIVGRSPPYDGVEVLFQTAVPYVCLLPETHALASGKGDVDLEEIAGTETFVTFGGAYPDEMLDIDHQLSARLRQSSRLSAANMPVAASLVRGTGALGIVDPYSAKIAQKLGGVVSRPIRQSLKYNIAIVTKGLDTLSLEAKELAELFIEKLAKRD
ncbi:LysR family transcriptional regulator [Pelagibius sp. Alg239-R121]|uniref:LysR family transcriptional regulator n=1 Tax=Pelagibius sp. Alg239-R121 TaxID=2993448 RepID=UPI0024A68689|nr:LysR family transcriptional regulator [Pelagibius sp. Alg239-R121]